MILLKLYEHSENNKFIEGKCFMDIKELMSGIYASRVGINESLKRLIELNLIYKKHKLIKNYGISKNIYRLTESGLELTTLLNNLGD